MSITEVLNSKKEDDVKISEIAEIVNQCRKNYGNEDKSVEAPLVHTTEGMLPLSMVSDKTKLVLAASQVKNISLHVLEEGDNVPGTNQDKLAEACIATDAILVNLATKTSFGSL